MPNQDIFILKMATVVFAETRYNSGFSLTVPVREYYSQ
jgi:hypothetical protein